MPTPPPPDRQAAALLDRIHFEVAPMVRDRRDGWRPPAADEAPDCWSLYRIVQVTGPDGRPYLERRHISDHSSQAKAGAAFKAALAAVTP